ncbi:MAG: cyclase family protein [Paracoccus denitrificans]|uniref:Cyclase family protein n=1 Tax=Paracoccus denitrificans TaxID=266 RepID=A0A533I326_PARDE|nr:MAG: cyclase family protein [Paracoccus denitrificans]
MKRWKNCPKGSNWGRFGEDDEIGTLNHIGPAERVAAAAEIREGLAFCLSLPLDLPGKIRLNPRRHPPRLSPTTLGETPYINYPLQNVDPKLQDVLSDDQVLLCTQYSTQWDSLAHVGAMFDADGDGVPEVVYYNGYRGGEDVVGQQEGSPHGSFARKLSVETMAKTGVQGRGVLLDLVRTFGPERRMIRLADLRRAMAEQGVDLRRGDILLLRTGFSEAIWAMQDKPDPEALEKLGPVLDGTDDELLQWLGDSELAAIAADNYAVECQHGYPDDCCWRAPMHNRALFGLGMPLAELWYLKELAEALAARGRNACFLTAPPLRLPGAIGSPVTPVATI